MSVNKKLQKQLKKMAQKDQKMRKSKIWDKKVDLENTKKLKAIVKKYGWPDIDLVGKEASHLAWLIVQHADHDVEFQEKCLKLMKQKLKEKKIDPIEVAYLTDRVRVNKGKKQIYGTQFYLSKNGKLIPRPIYDKKNLDKRRKKLDLGILRNIEKN